MVGVLATAGILGATALKERAATPSPVPTSAPGAAGDSAVAAAGSSADGTGASTVASAAGTSGGDVHGAPAVTPRIPPGRTALRDTMVAERAGDTVRVSFDLLMTRTRRPDKFERIVRETLPRVYGPVADSALRALPEGAVRRAGDLITTLPARGIHIPVAGGGTISIWPETRPGRDGPLVVAYRALASR
jgi:hypothetical protein